MVWKGWAQNAQYPGRACLVCKEIVDYEPKYASSIPGESYGFSRDIGAVVKEAQQDRTNHKTEKYISV